MTKDIHKMMVDFVQLDQERRKTQAKLMTTLKKNLESKKKLDSVFNQGSFMLCLVFLIWKNPLVDEVMETTAHEVADKLKIDFMKKSVREDQRKVS